MSRNTGLVLVDLSPEDACEIHTCEYDYEEDSYVKCPDSEDEEEEDERNE